MTIDEAIAEIKQSGLYGNQMHQETLVLALYALRTQQQRENPHPLTLEELKQMDGQPVWIRDLMDGEVECLRFDRIKPATYHTGDDYRFEQFGTSTGIIRWECKYGETWLAYRYPPKEDTI